MSRIFTCDRVTFVMIIRIMEVMSKIINALSFDRINIAHDEIYCRNRHCINRFPLNKSSAMKAANSLRLLGFEKGPPSFGEKGFPGFSTHSIPVEL